MLMLILLLGWKGKGGLTLGLDRTLSVIRQYVERAQVRGLEGHVLADRKRGWLWGFERTGLSKHRSGSRKL